MAATTGCLGLVQTNPEFHRSIRNLAEERGPDTGFGEDTQRGYDQYAFFGSADVDILHNLTLTAGSRYYHYKRVRDRLPISDDLCSQLLSK